MGKTICSWSTMPNSLAIAGMAILGRAEPMVELRISMAVKKRIRDFLAVDQLYGFSGSSTAHEMTVSFGRLLVRDLILCRAPSPRSASSTS